MATPKSQRVGIWIIALIMILGTLGSFLAMTLSIQNESIDQASLQKMQKDYSAKVAVQTKELSDRYYPEFSQYSSRPAVFNADDVKSLIKEDLKIGDGNEINADTTYNAYYIGWNPKGVIFDQSIKDGALIAPLPGGNMIEGWNEGVIGMRFGGIRELTIPSDKAYKDVARSEDIPANTPLKFIIMVIPKPAEVEMPDELYQYYLSQQQNYQ